MCEKFRTHIEVGGVILTQDALKLLHSWQESNNNMLRDSIENLADSVCMLARIQDGLSSAWAEESKLLIVELSLLRDHLKYLKKP